MRKKRTLYLRDKLILLLLCLIVLPLLLFGTLLFHFQQRITTSFIRQTMAASVAQQADRLSQEIYTIRSMGNLFYLDKSVISALDQSDGPDAEALKQLSQKYCACLGKLHANVSFLGQDGQYYGNIPTSALPDADRLLSEINLSASSTAWLTSYDLFPIPPISTSVYAVRPIHKPDSWIPVGTLVIAVQESELRKICSGYLSKSQNACLIDRNGNLLCEVNNQNIPWNVDPQLFSQYTGSFYLADSDQLVSYYTESNAKWILAISSSEKALLEPYVDSTQTFITLIILYFFIAVALSFVVSKRFVRPIHELQKNIDLVKQGNLNAMVPVTSSDEIGQLSERYNEMLQQIKSLLKGLMDTQQAQHEAEMLALQAQINPHFIYNTLASIRFLVFSGKKEETDRALLSLGNILHGTLSNPHDLSTVGQEIKLLQNYIDLQRISFSHPLSVSFDVDKDVYSCQICKLSLQPIVENAFIHGFTSSGNSACSLSLCAKSIGNDVEISISDNGIGFDPAAKPEKKPTEDDPPHTGLGIGNVHERLKLAFGPQYGLRIESSPGSGTTVYVTIPKRQKKGDVFIYDSSDC